MEIAKGILISCRTISQINSYKSNKTLGANMNNPKVGKDALIIKLKWFIVLIIV